MAKRSQPRQVDRHTTLACLSVATSKVAGEHKNAIITTFKKQGWGVLAEANNYRFIHFDENIATDVSSILDGLDCDQTGWLAYRLSFPTAEAAKLMVDSAEWR